MSAVDTTTGEVVEYDRPAAERRAERIRLRLDSIADSYAAVMPMIRESIEKRDDQALGYRSVGEYVSDRFGGALSRLGVEVRREVVRELTEAGMSTRAIAPIVGVSQKTVVQDSQATRQVIPEVSPAPPAPQGEQDSESGADDPAATEATPGDNRPPDYPAAPAPAARPAVTGIDGKTYKRPEPKAPPRRALTDQFFDAAYDLTKAVERVGRLAADDRFPQNAEKVAAKHRSDLLHAIDGLQSVINRLPSA